MQAEKKKAVGIRAWLKQFGTTPMGPALSLLAAAVLLTGMVYLITTTHLFLVGMQLLRNPTLLLLNILPTLLLLLLFFFLTRRLVFSVSLCGAAVLLLAIVDRIKVTMRQEPLLPTDLTLRKEALAIFKNFPFYQRAGVILLLIALLLLLGISLRRARVIALPPLARILGVLLVLICGLGANRAWYANEALYDSYNTIGNPYFQVNQYNTRGLLYSFLHQCNILQAEVPAGYDAGELAALEDVEWEASEKVRPHIIMIMGEAFSDLSENEHLDFTGYGDPLENWKEICAEEGTISGHLVVPNFGGGTSNTEYDVLTGCGDRYLGSALPAYSFIHREFDGLPRQLRKLGYETIAIHPGYGWFYNRQNVYPDLGFEATYFLEDSFDLATQGYGGYINETATMDKIIETLEGHIAKSDAPLFSFTVTIQNHGPYEKKYGTLPQNFDCDIALDETQTDLLTQYFEGIQDADAELGRLKEYAEASEEPIVLVYFGDHLPGFSNGMEFFELLDYPIDANGTTEEQLAVYETPYLIWQNESAKALTKTTEEIEAPEGGVLSSQFLGSMVLELCDADYESPLHRQNNALRRELPVCAGNIYVDASGEYKTEVSEEQRERVEQLARWQYYKLFDEETP